MRFFFLLFITLLCQSCFNNPLYKPNESLTPTFEQKGDIDAQGTLNMNDGIQGSLGYSATNHFGVFIGGANHNSTDSANTSASITKYGFGAVGYYTQIAKTTNNKVSDTYYLGFYGGIGTGYNRVKGTWKEPKQFGVPDRYRRSQLFHQRGSFNSYFAQVNISVKEDYKKSDIPIWAVVSGRFQYIDFYDYDNFVKEFRTDKTDTDALFFELAISVEFSILERFNASMYYGYTTQVNDEELNYEYKKSRFNAGFSYNVNVKGNNKQHK